LKRINLLLVMVLLGTALFQVATPLQTYAAAQDAALTVDVRAGFDGDGRYRVGHWFPVSIVIANDGADMRSTIVWRFPGNDETFHYVIDLPRGARKQVDLPVLTSNSRRSAELQVFVHDSDTLLARRTVRLDPVGNSQIFVGVVSNDLTLLNSLAAAEIQSGLSTEVTHLDPQRLPADVALLNGLDVIFVHEFPAAGLQAEQLAALMLWTDLGGQLVVGGGPNAEQTVAALVDWLPVTVGSLRENVPVTGLERLAGRSDLSNGLSGLRADSVDLRPEARNLDQEGLITVRDQGAGRVFYAAFELNALRAWAGESDLWARVLDGEARLLVGSSFRARSENLLRNSLRLPSLQIPSTGIILLLILFYIVIIGPVNFLVLRRLRRIELAWVTTPLLVLVFLVGSFVISLGLRGTQPQTIQLAVVQGFEGSDRSFATAFVGVFSPQRRSYDIRFAPDALVTGSTFDGFSIQTAPVTSDASSTGMSDLLIDVSSLRTLLVEDSGAQVPPLVSQIERNNNSVSGSLTYQGSAALEAAMIVSGDSFQMLGALAPGATVEIQVDRRANNFPNGLFIEEAELFDRQQVLYDLFSYDRFALGGPMFDGMTGLPDVDGVYLLGWANQPALEVGITNAQEPQGQILYIIHLEG
jgi:uncharacterized membrane protein YhaH (DUF805 family)